MTLRYLFCALMLLALIGCNVNERHPLELDLRRSFRSYIFAVEELNEEGLENLVFFPGVAPGKYRDHVRRLLSDYLTWAPRGHVTFDEQGVVLSRFLRMTFHNYQVIDIQSVDERDTRMRLAFSFSYDSLLEKADYEEGTRVLIPGEPLGKVHTFIVGGANEIPRSQLSYIEVDVFMRRTQYEGFFQIRRLVAVPGTEEFEESFRG